MVMYMQPTILPRRAEAVPYGRRRGIEMTTREVCQRFGVSILRVRNLIALGRIEPPDKNGSGDYVWLEPDVKRLLEAVPPRIPRKALAEPTGPISAT